VYKISGEVEYLNPSKLSIELENLRRAIKQNVQEVEEITFRKVKLLKELRAIAW
jgi:hypothetical protein